MATDSAAIFGTNYAVAMGLIRGQWHAWRGVRLMPTFHPSYVLRTYTEATRKAVWDDLKAVMAEVGIAAPRGGATGDDLRR
jgi:uracil-DNA glycosylase